MATVWLLPFGTDPSTVDGVNSGDYVLRPTDDGLFEVGHQDRSCTWVGTVSPDLLPQLPQVDSPQEGPEQEKLLAAVQGVESAQTHRGG
jgi:hypothetical protein